MVTAHRVQTQTNDATMLQIIVTKQGRK
jgi:hypothetical protein